MIFVSLLGNSLKWNVQQTYILYFGIKKRCILKFQFKQLLMDFLMLHAILILENIIIKYKFISDSALYPLSLSEVGILKQPSDISIVIKNNDYCHSYKMFDEVFQPSLRPRGRGYAFIDISNVFKLKTGRVIQRSMLYRQLVYVFSYQRRNLNI